MAFVNATSTQEYSQWLEKQNKSLKVYLSNFDKQFLDSLEKSWSNFKTKQNIDYYEKPKTIPINKIVEKQPYKKPSTINVSFVPKKLNKKPLKVISDNDNNLKLMKLEFYSQKLSIKYDKKTSFSYTKNTNMQNNISDFWKRLGTTNYKIFIKQIDKISSYYNLNDWAKYQLIHKIGTKIYKNNNTANMFVWFVLSKMQYDVKIAYDKSKVYLLATVSHNLYQVTYIELNHKKYYILNTNGKTKNTSRLSTYDSQYKNANKRLQLGINKEIKFYTNLKNKTLIFTDNGTKYKIKTQISKDLIDFYDTFPQSQYSLYFKAKKSKVLSNSILSSLRKIIKGKSQVKSIDLLLNFVQNAFRYKTDDEQFGYEKVMFPSQTVFYASSDCEDRSIIFAYLVDNLLKLDVVAVKYANHLATAIKLKNTKYDGGFRYKQHDYTVADPTYINANFGQVMPSLKNAKFEVIEY